MACDDTEYLPLDTGQMIQLRHEDAAKHAHQYNNLMFLFPEAGYFKACRNANQLHNHQHHCHDLHTDWYRKDFVAKKERALEKDSVPAALGFNLSNVMSSSFSEKWHMARRSIIKLLAML
jgi:hypothetical protein